MVCSINIVNIDCINWLYEQYQLRCWYYRVNIVLSPSKPDSILHIYVYVYAYVYVCMHACMHVHTHTYTHIHTYVHVRVCMEYGIGFWGTQYDINLFIRTSQYLKPWNIWCMEGLGAERNTQRHQNVTNCYLGLNGGFDKKNEQ